VALIVEVRNRSRAEAAFRASPLSVLPIGVPPEVVTGLLRAASDPHAGVRFDALHVLSLLAPAPLDATSADRLTNLLGDADPGTRLAATRALGRLQVKTAGEALIHGMNDPDERVRLAAMRAVGELGDERAVQALTERLQYHGRGPAAEAALDGLARIGHSSSEPVFRQHLGDRAPALRRIAAEGLARSVNPTLAQELELLRSGERDDSVRLALSFALQRMGRPYLDRLIEPLANGRLAGQSHGYLLELGASSESIRALHSYTRDPDPAIRAVVVDVLGMVGGPPEVTLLEPLRQDPHPMVAAAATRAVSRLQLGLERGAP
jgi:HEAT repeat protein